MITVHYLNNSRAHRVLWLLEELELAYDIRTYQRDARMGAPESLKKVHPLGKSPVIEDDGLMLAESGAIVEYLIETYGDDQLIPERGTQAWRDYTYWLHYAEGSAMPLLVMKLVFASLPAQVPFLVRPVARLISRGIKGQLLDPQIRDHVSHWESALAHGGWFAGDSFTAADIMMSFPVEAGASRIDYGRQIPKIRAYMEAIRERPAYKRALECGGAYGYAATAA